LNWNIGIRIGMIIIGIGIIRSGIGMEIKTNDWN